MIVKNNRDVYQIQELLLPGLIHGFSPKTFGNMSYKYGEKSEVDRNRLNFAQAAGINASSVVKMDLIHGTKVMVVGKKEAGSLNADKYVPETDGLITNSSEVALWLLTGDCSPILFFDQKKKVIGVAHAGWRGTAGKLPTLMFMKMLQNFDCQPENILVGIGPSIEKCHYIKGKPILMEDFPEWKQYLTPVDEERLAVDLNGFTISKLLEVGAKRENIFYSKFCVADHNDEFFSQQMEKTGKDKAGRFATVIQMK